MKWALKFTQSKDRTSNCVAYSILPDTYLSILFLSHLIDVHLCRQKVNQCGGRVSERERDGGGKRDGKRKNKRRGIKRKEQKYEERISSTPYAFIV